MKKRINLTIDEQLLKSIRNYAESNDVSISELAADLFTKVVKPERQNSIVNFVAGLPKPKIDITGDLQELYYKEQAKKYGL